jgi:hypothetical protein
MPYDIYSVHNDCEEVLATDWPAHGYAVASANKWMIVARLGQRPIDHICIREAKTNRLTAIVTDKSVKFY